MDHDAIDVIYIVHILTSFKDYEGILVDFVEQYLFEYKQEDYYRHPIFRSELISAFLEDNKLDPETTAVIDVVPTQFILSKKHTINKNNNNPKLN